MKKTLTLMLIGSFLLMCVLILWDINPDILLFALNIRWTKIWAILVTGSALGVSTLVFQTVTGNRILSPGILGLDNLYLMLNLILVFVLGIDNKFISNPYINFFLSSTLMALFSTQLYIKIFVKIKSLYKVILLGVVMSTLFTSIIGMLQVFMNPDSYNVILEKLFASYSVINKDLLLLSTVILVTLSVVFVNKHRLLDVLSLGIDKATNLGVDYHKELKWILIITFILISISTALVGPVSFLGFLSANISRSILPTHKHKYLIPGTILSSISTLFIGQILVERVFAFGLPIGVLISLWGGIYFIVLVLRGTK